MSFVVSVIHTTKMCSRKINKTAYKIGFRVKIPITQFEYENILKTVSAVFFISLTIRLIIEDTQNTIFFYFYIY